MPRKCESSRRSPDDEEARALVAAMARAMAQTCACRLTRTDARLVCRVDVEGVTLERVAAELSLSPEQARARLAHARELAARELVACLCGANGRDPDCGHRRHEAGGPERPA